MKIKIEEIPDGTFYIAEKLEDCRDEFDKGGFSTCVTHNEENLELHGFTECILIGKTLFTPVK